MPRVYTRRFDYDEARRRHAAGESYATLAREYGVHSHTVRRACDDDYRARLDASTTAFNASGVCETCGKTGVTSAAFRRLTRGDAWDGRVLCIRCRGDERCERLRFDDDGTLIAVRCTTVDCANGERWQTPDHFPRGQRHREVREGGIAGLCRACQTRTRRQRRQRNPDADNAYQREYHRRKRASA